MPAKLPSRKKKQIKRFFADYKKVGRLKRFAEKRGDKEKSKVFHTNIAGRKRTVKISDIQELASANNKILHRAHRKALEKGTIKAELYELVLVSYVYADKRVGVMTRMSGMGFSTLFSVLGSPVLYSSIAELRKTARKVSKFCEENPGITVEKLSAMREELLNNLRELSNDMKLFSFDLAGVNNIIVQGINRKNGKLRIALVDQIFPDDHPTVERILAEKKARSKAKNKNSKT